MYILRPHFVNYYRHNRCDLAIHLGFAALALFFSWPVFEHPEYWGIQDWGGYLFFEGVVRESLLKYRQLPLWNPYMYGGMPLLAYPQSDVLAPSFFLTLVYGEVVGTKIAIWLHLALGLSGTFALARYYSMERLPALFAALLYMLSSMYVGAITVGMLWAYSIGYIPWAILCYLKSWQERKYAYGAGIFLSLMWLGGGVYPFCITIIFICGHSILALCLRQVGFSRILKAGLLIMLCTGCLSAVKLVPAVELTLQYPRPPHLYAGFSLESLAYGLWGRDQTITAINDKSDEEGFLRGFTHGLDEVGLYIGIVPFLLFLLGLYARGRQHLLLAICFLLFLWLGFGHRAGPLSLWAWLEKVPFIGTMRTVERFSFIFMLCLALFSGFGLQHLTSLLGRFRHWHRLAPALVSTVIVILVLADLLSVNRPVLDDAFSIPPLPVQRLPEFRQFVRAPDYDKDGFVTLQTKEIKYSSFGDYYAFLSNAGTLESEGGMTIVPHAIPATSEYYMGEIFLYQTRGRAEYRLWTPNRLTLEVQAQNKGYVVINQNYFPGWHLQGPGEVENLKGLLAVAVTPQTRRLELYYLPYSFPLGLAITCGSILFFLLVGGYHRWRHR